MTEEKQIRVVGERGKLAFEKFNQPVWDEEAGEWVIENDLTATKADFVVDEQDYRETLRQAQAEQLFEMMGRLPPEVSFQLLDLVIEMTDLPGKDEIVQRIRKMNGQIDPEEENSPEQQQALLQKQQADAIEQQLQQRERLAKIGKDEAAAKKAGAEAQKTNLSAKKEALETASALSQATGLAPAADQLMATPEEAPQ